MILQPFNNWHFLDNISFGDSVGFTTIKKLRSGESDVVSKLSINIGKDYILQLVIYKQMLIPKQTQCSFLTPKRTLFSASSYLSLMAEGKMAESNIKETTRSHLEGFEKSLRKGSWIKLGVKTGALLAICSITGMEQMTKICAYVSSGWYTLRKIW